MTRFFTIILVAAVPIALYLYASERGFTVTTFFGPDRPLIEIGSTPMSVEVLDTPAARIQGLSGRESLPTNGGVLFIFDESEYHGIWMKDMLLSIDIIWIDEKFTVVHIEENVHPSTYPTVFEPDVPARFVVETSSRFAETYGIKEGDRVSLPRNLIPEDLQE